MRDSLLPRAHGAWLVLGTAILLGLLSGQRAGPGTLALSLAAVFGFCATERLLTGLKDPAHHREALHLGLLYAALGLLTGIWATWEVGPERLLWLAALAPLLGWVQFRLARRPQLRPAYEALGMVSLSLVLPAVSLSTGCPVGWPLYALSAVFTLHVLHAAFRTRAHLRPRQREMARWAGSIGGLVLLGLVGSGGVSVPFALAVAIGLAEPWAPDWRPLPARRIGLRETALIALLPLALLIS